MGAVFILYTIYLPVQIHFKVRQKPTPTGTRIVARRDDFGFGL